jgi:hypothetical protein
MSKLILPLLVLFMLASIPSAANLIGMPGSERPATSRPSKPGRQGRLSPHKPQAESIDWRHWVVTGNFRYRAGCRYAGGTNWERYLELENTAGATLRFSGIAYGEVHADDVVLSPASRSIQIKLVCGPVASWSWDVTPYPIH